MINCIPLLKKGTTQEEKEKRYPKTLVLNSLMMLFGGIMIIVGLDEKGASVFGIIFLAIGFMNLLFSIMKINLINKKNKKQ